MFGVRTEHNKRRIDDEADGGDGGRRRGARTTRRKDGALIAPSAKLRLATATSQISFKPCLFSGVFYGRGVVASYP